MKNSTRCSAFIVVLFIIMTTTLKGQVSLTQIPLNPKNVPQFVDPLPHFAGLRINAKGGGHLTIAYEPTQQIAVSTGTILDPRATGLANLWAYSVTDNSGIVYGPYWPAFTIEAMQGFPLNVTYVNNLGGQTYYDVGLIADQTLHWADPLMEGLMADPPNMMNMAPYTGPIPVVPHLHGGEVASESDGGPDSWFTPGYSETGPSWEKGADENYVYPNTQEPATLWWHDHALGVTRLNVYAGLAGFYFLRGPNENGLHLPGWSGDNTVTEAVTNRTYLPEIEIVFQDRMFDTKGQLYFPNLPPNAMDHPFWTPEFLGDIITVNGKTWPYLSVAPRKYRFRLLNGSNARFYEIQLKDLVTGALGPAIVQIGTDGGLLDAPVKIKGKLLLAPGERADVIIDFTGTAGRRWTIVNSARAPYPKGSPPIGSTTGRLMQFVVNGTANGVDNSVIPATLRSPGMIKLTDWTGKLATDVTITKKRQLTLNERMGMGGPLEVLVNNTKWDGNGMANPGLGETELPQEGTTELWQIINLTADAHPMHLHLVQFQIVSRQPFNVSNYNKAYSAAFTGGVYIPAAGPPKDYNAPNTPDGAVGGNPAVSPYLQNGLRPPAANERGWKDTHVVMPGEVTTFIVRFAPTDKAIKPDADPSLKFAFDPRLGPGYVWHCHIIDHEDNEMMRPYMVEGHPSRPPLPPPTPPVNNTEFARAAKVTDNKSNVSVEKFQSENIDKVVLGQNYPNPFSGQTEIIFNLPQPAHVQITLYNAAGIKMKVLLDSNAPAGINNLRLDAAGLADGVYFYELRTGFVSQTKRMVVKK